MIEDIKTGSVKNSKNTESLSVSLITKNGNFSASVPSGTSTGKNEASDLPIHIVEKNLFNLKKKIIGINEDWRLVDKTIKKIDMTPRLSVLGGNLALGLSIASARAETKNRLWLLGSESHIFPFQLANMIGGGKHGGNTNFQEFLLFSESSNSPIEDAKNIKSAYIAIGSELKNKRLILGKNREAAWTSKLDDIKTLDFISDFAEQFNMRIGIDCAASSLWNGRHYLYKDRKMNSDQQLDFVTNLIQVYKIRYIEDPFHEEDFSTFKYITGKVRRKCLVVGDDLFCTNPDRLKRGIKSASGIIVKPNQAGTLSKTFETVKLANKNKITTIASHRSKETKDNWLADLSVVWNSKLIKIGVGQFDRPKTDRLIKLWNLLENSKMSSI